MTSAGFYLDSIKAEAYMTRLSNNPVSPVEQVLANLSMSMIDIGAH